MMQALVYVAPGCNACKQAVEFLRSHNIEVVEKDARLYPELCSSVPVIQIGKVTVLGFSPPTLRRVVEAQQARESLTNR